MSAASISGDPQYFELKNHVLASTGLAYYQSRDGDLLERIGRRLRLLGVGGCGDYLAVLRDPARGPAELDHLIAELTIGETFFFRDEQQFEALRNLILPDLLRRNQAQRTLRIWSAGCSSGAEAYSLSIVLRDDLGIETTGWNISILGTDLNRKLLAQAAEGRYEKWALRSTPEAIRERCFEQDGSHWRIAGRYREGVQFRYHNLVHGQVEVWADSLDAFDLILCRNVMIYFDQPTKIALVERLRACLRPDAWLVVGHADHEAHVFQAFEAVLWNGLSVYRRRGGPPSEAKVSERQRDADPKGAAPIPGASREPCVAAPSMADMRARADAGKWAEAERLCAAMVERSPLDATPHFYLALILEQMGRSDEAERSLRRAVYLDRRFVLAHYHLGLLLRRGRRPLPARQYFENVLALLAGVHDGHIFEHGDGIRAADLRSLTEMNLEGL